MGWGSILKGVAKYGGGLIPSLISGNGPGPMFPVLNSLWNMKHQHKENSPALNDSAAALPQQHRGDSVPQQPQPTQTAQDGHVGTDNGTAARKSKKEAAAAPQQIQFQAPQQAAPTMMPIEHQWLNLNPVTMDRTTSFKNPYARNFGG